MITFCINHQFLTSFFLICCFINTSKSGKFVCSNCENKHTQNTCSKEGTCNFDSSRSNNIGPYIRLQPIVRAKQGIQNNTNEKNDDIAQDPREKFFFVETSQRDYLQKRQACAIESAIETQNRKGLKGKEILVVVVMTSDVLDINGNNATNQLYVKYMEPFLNESSKAPLAIRCLGYNPVDSILHGTPLQSTRIWNHINSTQPFRMAHLSDALRLVLIYKFGGWYADIDTVSLKPLEDLGKGIFLSSDQKMKSIKDRQKDENGNAYIGKTVANGFFGFIGASYKKSPFLYRTMEYFVQKFDNRKWDTGGSRVLTKTLREYCNIPFNDDEEITVGGRYSVENCQGIRILESYHFFPMSWMEATEMATNSKSEIEWKDIIKDSYSIDFFRSSSNNTTPILKRKYYGRKIPAYAFLGPEFCPLSFYSENTF